MSWRIGRSRKATNGATGPWSLSHVRSRSCVLTLERLETRVLPQAGDFSPLQVLHAYGMSTIPDMDLDVAVLDGFFGSPRRVRRV
jgi:hypothetical protein